MFLKLLTFRYGDILDTLRSYTTSLKCSNWILDPLWSWRGIKHGDPLSSEIFNLIIDWVISTLAQDIERIGGQKCDVLAFVDDIMLAAEILARMEIAPDMSWFENGNVILVSMSISREELTCWHLYGAAPPKKRYSAALVNTLAGCTCGEVAWFCSILLLFRLFVFSSSAFSRTAMLEIWRVSISISLLNLFKLIILIGIYTSLALVCNYSITGRWSEDSMCFTSVFHVHFVFFIFAISKTLLLC